MIQNPRPIKSGDFSQMWLSIVGIHLSHPGVISGRFQPYDGVNLLSTGFLSIHVPLLDEKRSKDSTLSDVIGKLIVECRRQAGSQQDVRSVFVLAPNPGNPVTATVIFSGGEVMTIRDCFSEMGKDEQFASVFTATMNELARQAGLIIE